MVERVIEERAGGNPSLAEDIRERIGRRIGTELRNISPGSDQAGEVKEALIREGLWSQYLEVGIGPDAEVFTKCPVLSSVGPGAKIGIQSGVTLEQSRARTRARREFQAAASSGFHSETT